MGMGGGGPVTECGVLALLGPGGGMGGGGAVTVNAACWPCWGRVGGECGVLGLLGPGGVCVGGGGRL